MPKGVYKRKVRPLEQRFWGKVDRTSDCWEWTARKTKAGYGVLRDNGSNRYAHRISWEIHNKTISPGLHVLHHCDNPPCVNPKHLFLGTHSDNMKDAYRKGRLNTPINLGENHGNSKVTKEVVKIIRKLYERIDLNQTKLAEEFNLRQDHISDIVNYKTWKNI